MASNLDAYDPVFEAAGQEWNVNPQLLKAVAMQESQGNPQAESKVGAQGLMGIMPNTGKTLGLAKPFDPTESIWAGAKYLSQALDAEGTPERALAYYHGGPNWASPGLYRTESAAYVPAVTQRYLTLAKAQQPAQAAPAASGGDAGGKAAPGWDAFTKAVSGTAQPGTAQPGTAQPGTAQPAPSAEPKAQSWDEFRASVGATEPAQTAEASGDAGPDAFGMDVTKLAGPQPDYAGAVQIDRDLSTVQGVRNALADPQGWTPSGILPMAVKNNPQGEADPSLGVRWDLGPLRPVARGVLDLLEGPRTGTLTPEAQAVLFGAMTGGQLLPSVARGTGAAVAGSALAAADRKAAPLSPQFTDNPLSPAYAGPRAVAPPQPTTTIDLGGKPVEIPAKPAEAPQSGGAAASRDPTVQTEPVPEMTMAEYKANRKQGELNQIMEPNQGPDNTVYVKTESGAQSIPTLAERSFDPALSQQEKLLRERDPNKFEPQLRANMAARVEQYEEDMGSAPAREAINTDIQELAKKEQPLVLRNAKPLDLSHTQDVLNGILNDPRQTEVDAVRKVIGPLRDALADSAGNLKTNPLSGWGMIDNIRNKIENSNLDSSVERHVVSQLLEVKKALTQDMDASTGGKFSAYLGKQNELLQKRNAMDVLQNFRPSLTNAKGDIQFAAYHRWLLGLAKKRGGPGADPAMAIPDSTMRKLIGIDKDLKRAQNIDLGSSRGSHTNLMFALSKSMGLGLVHAAVHGGVAAMGGGGVGNLMAQQALTAGAAKVNALNLRRQVRKHLAPGPEGRNWLAD